MEVRAGFKCLFVFFMVAWGTGWIFISNSKVYPAPPPLERIYDNNKLSTMVCFIDNYNLRIYAGFLYVYSTFYRRDKGLTLNIFIVLVKKVFYKTLWRSKSESHSTCKCNMFWLNKYCSTITGLNYYYMFNIFELIHVNIHLFGSFDYLQVAGYN